MEKKNNLKKKNEMCIVGFISSFLSSILGLLFSIIGIKQVNKRNEKGKSFAIAGILISCLKIVVFIIINNFFIYPSIDPRLNLNTACANVDELGNFEINTTDIESFDDGYVLCRNFKCLIIYNKKYYTKKCD